MTGIFAELTREVATRAGFDVEYVRYPEFPSALTALAEGQGDVLAGVAQLPLLDGRVVWSDPFGNSEVHLFIRSEETRDLSLADLEGQRIAVVRNTVGSDIPETMGGSIAQPFATVGGAFAALLSKEVEGVVIIHQAAANHLQAAQLEHRVRVSGPPLRTQSHFVAVRPEFAELMPRINQAIAKMKADGTVQAIFERWNMLPPPAPPGILTVGVLDFPPYTVIEGNGRFSGFAVELLRILADRGGIPLRFKEINQKDWLEGPRIGAFDLLPVRSITEAESEYFVFTSPVETIAYKSFATAENTDTPFVPRNGNLGLLAISPLRAEISEQLGVTLTLFDDLEEGVRLLREGEISAINFPRSTFLDYVEDNRLEGDFVELEEPSFTNDLGIVARPGLGETVARLNLLISGFIGSQEYRDLYATWFEEPEFWTANRIATLIYSGLGLAVFGLAAFVFQATRARQRAEHLRQIAETARSRLSTVLTSTSQAVFGFSEDRSLILANPSGRSLLGLKHDDEPLAWPASAQFVGLRHDQQLDFGLNSTFAAPRDITGELCRFRRSQNEPFQYVRVTIDEVDPDGSDLASIMIVENDNENELNRQKLERAHRLSSLGILVGGLAHDFNNTLGSIMLNAQLGKMNMQDHGLLFDRIVAAVKSGQQLTGNLLSFSRTENASSAKINIAESFEQLRILAESAISEAITLILPNPPHDLQVRCGKGDLENALLNLILNARDAIQMSGTGNRIVVSIRTYGSDALDESVEAPVPMIEISVSDNGPGMSDEVKRLAVDPFFTTKDSSGGTGLGLATVDAFANRMSGSMSIYSELGRGTTVRLLLPAEAGADFNPTFGDEVIWRGDGEHILLVEDQQKLREPMAELLHELGYQVTAAENGLVARDLLSSDKGFDLVLSDIVMPGGVSGIDLAELVRDQYPRLRIVLMTGYADSIVELPNRVDVVVLQKPVPAAGLTRAIAHALATRSGS